MDLSVCRLCCNNTGTAYIFDPSNGISKKIMYCCTRICISEEDGLPQRVCTSCAVELTLAYQFVLKCESADEKLRSERLTGHEIKPDIEIEKESHLNNNIDDNFHHLYGQTPTEQLSVNKIKPDIELEKESQLNNNFHHLDEVPPSEQLSEHDIKIHIELEEKTKLDLEDDDFHQMELTTDSYQDDVKLGEDIKLDIEENLCLDLQVPSYIYQEKKDKSICSKKSSLSLKIKAEKNKIRNKKQKYNKNKGNENIQCTHCGLKCKNPSTLAFHMRSHSEDRPFACSSCDKKYKDKGALKRHVETNHNTERKREFICETCGKGFYTKNSIKIHFRTHTGETPYACDICPAKFNQIGTLNSHKLRHRNLRSHMCTICNKSFVTKDSLRHHQAVHSSEKKYTCTTCNAHFKHKNNLRKHINSLHTQTKQYICDYCRQNFTTKGNLRIHIERIHSDKSGLCAICYKNVPDVDMHMLRHNGIKSFKCDICSSSFFLLRSLSIHKSFRHKNNEKFKCTKDGCTMTFPSRPMLKFHEAKFHGSEVTFPCDKCSKGFYRKSDLSRHKSFYHKKKIVE